MSRVRKAPLLLVVFLLLPILVSVAAAQEPQPPQPRPPISELAKYMIIAMANDADTRALQMSCAELGANRIMLSTPSSPTWTQINGCLPNLAGTFGLRWNTGTDPDSMYNAATVFQGIDHSGNVALTSTNGQFDASNTVTFAGIGYDMADATPNTGLWSSGNDYYPAAPNSPVPDPLGLANGVNEGASLAALLAELSAWKTYVAGLAADETITSLEAPYNFTDNPATGGLSGGLQTTHADANGDGVIVIDFNINGDFTIHNTDWVINPTDNTLLILRVLNGSNVTVNNASVLMHSSDCCDFADLGAIFYQASEGSSSGDTVFSIGNNVVLNGIAFWDLNAVGEGGGNIKTSININNGQGCTQFISQKLNVQNGRWVRCATSPAIPTAITLQQVAGAGANSMLFGWAATAGLILAAITVAAIALTAVRRPKRSD